MENINWGIIGCGDVTEKKSGPAFNKVPNSKLVAVMRRNAAKAEDYAARHGVPKWYSNAEELINDPEINAIYVATPPDSHEAYTIAALKAGKPVYVEKPMALNTAASKNMAQVAKEKSLKLSVAHYRREQPLFKKIKALIDENAIGDIKMATINHQIPAAKFDFDDEKIQWRINPSIAGGGIFHDLAPHQLDLMIYFFGEVEKATGVATNQAGLYAADDIVSGSILFKNKTIFNGLWCFAAPDNEKTEYCEIVGTKGKIKFSIFDKFDIEITKGTDKEVISFEQLQHVQQPMIEKVTAYFLNQAANPCSAEDGVVVMDLMEKMTIQ